MKIDATSIFVTIFGQMWWVLSALLLIMLFKSTWFNGFMGKVMASMATSLCHEQI